MSSPPHHPFPNDMTSNPDPFEWHWGLLQPASSTEVPNVEMEDVSNLGESYPLSGASVYILTGGDNDEHAATAAANEMAAFVAALGGQSVPLPEDATHALYVPVPVSQPSVPNSESTTTNLGILQSKIVECQAFDVPIVDKSWLERMSGLQAEEHWSQIELGSFVPPIVALIDQGQGQGQGQGQDALDPIGEQFDGHSSAPVGSVSSGGGSIFRRMSSFGSSVRRNKRERQPPRTSIRGSISGGGGGGGGGSNRDAHSRMSQSLSQTAAYLSQENPEQMEQDAIKRAMELSMLDVALVLRRGESAGAASKGNATKSQQPVDPHDILGVPGDASVEVIKAAYRKLALATHPDKGGSADDFFRVARAYRALLNPGHDTTKVASAEAGPISLKSTSHWDAELQDHRRLVEDLFANHGANLQQNAQKLQSALNELGLSPYEAGSINRNERNELISNSCFYLSLANSYLRGIGALTCPDGIEGVDKDVAQKLTEADDALIGETALQLKRLIEAAVVKAHPEWAARGWVGEDVQAFSDFLTFTLDSSTLLADWAVCVFDTTSGFVDVYKGKGYKSIAEKDRNWASTNTITLRYVPGHYQPLIQMLGGTRPNLGDVLACLDQTGVCYVVTDG